VSGVFLFSILLTIWLVVAIGAAPGQAQPPPPPPPAPPAAPLPEASQGAAPTAPVLTLDEALATAVVGNRTLSNARLEVVKAKKNASAFNANFYPVIQTELHASELLTPVNVKFQQGAFGTFAATGPIPSSDINITTPERLTTYFTIAVRQPITQLPRLALASKAKEIDVALAAEDVRNQRQSLVTDVKKAYFAILETEASLVAAVESVQFYRELERTIANRYKQKTVLKTDLLDVQKRLAESEFDLQQQKDALATNKSQLNLLLGRDIHLDFQTREVAESPLATLSLPDLEKLALAQRPQVRQAVLRVKQAELDRRVTAAQYSPELNLELTYVKPQNAGLFPDQLFTVGASMTWVPITWGKVSNEIQAKTQALLQAQNNQAQVSDQVRVEVGSQFRTVQTDLERVRATRVALDAARESLRVARVRYGQKTVLLQDVYDAQTRVASAMRNYLEAVLAENIAQAELEQAVGED
jgi:outer membrane protein TolC